MKFYLRSFSGQAKANYVEILLFSFSVQKKANYNESLLFTFSVEAKANYIELLLCGSLCVQEGLYIFLPLSRISVRTVLLKNFIDFKST